MAPIGVAASGPLQSGDGRYADLIAAPAHTGVAAIARVSQPAGSPSAKPIGPRTASVHTPMSTPGTDEAQPPHLTCTEAGAADR